jgi:hypothetical protein
LGCGAGISLPHDVGGGLGATPDVELHCGADAFVPHHHHRHGRHDPDGPAIAEGAAEIVGGGMFLFARLHIEVDDNGG